MRDFQYLGSYVEENGTLDIEIDKHVVNTSRAFGELRQAVFSDDNLSSTIKRKFTKPVYYRCCSIGERELDTTKETQ